MTHYIYMSGTPGCLPDYTSTHDNLGDAAANLPMLFSECDGYESNLLDTLARDHVLYFTPEQARSFGAQYAEIAECNCPTPEEHISD